MKRLLLLLIPLALLGFAFYAEALPVLPTEFYGNIITLGQNASLGGTITANRPGVTCDSFIISTEGGFGLITCPHDDPTTPVTEGVASNGVGIKFFYNGQNVVVLSGDNTTDSGAFKYLSLSHPVPVCGDNFCDLNFETNASCPADCNAPPGGNTTNTTGNGTGTGGGGGGGGGGGSSGGGSGSGGSGGSGGGAVSSIPFTGIIQALEGVVTSSGIFGCTEEWVCTEWSNCTIEGLQQRTCEDISSCGTLNSKPREIQECLYDPTCYDRIQNGDETGVDCGGSKCELCPGCSNGIQDGDETGVDCGGSCRPCDSCFDGVQNYKETGVDCGGPCIACFESAPPVLEFPTILCDKPLNPLENDAWWFILVVLILTVIRILLYWKELHQIKKDELLDDFKRDKKYRSRRREMVLFILVVVAVCLLSYAYYYEFLLCNQGYQYLWAYLLILILVPLIIFAIMRALTYSDERKLALIKKELRSHEDILREMLVFENKQLVEIETEIAQLIERVATNLEMVNELNKFPELKQIYKDIVRLYDEYHENKTPTGIEKDLCDQVYKIETDENFKGLTEKYPDIGLLHQKLVLVYHHYEGKQQLYDELAQLEEKNEAKFTKVSTAEESSGEDLGEDWESKGDEQEEE